MILKALFLVPDDFDDAVTLVDAIDEYAWDAGANWAADDMEATRRTYGDGRYVEVDIDLDDAVLGEALRKPTIEANDVTVSA